MSDPGFRGRSGFAARGELRKNSDIDLLSVVADAPRDRPRAIRKSP